VPITDHVLQISIVTGVVALAWVGVLLTAFTLPGIWVAIVAMGIGSAWHSSQFGTELFSWWTLAACVVLGILAELGEMGASALGAAKVGGSRKAAIASVIGAMVGALLGTFVIPIPVVGTIIGAALGAGGAALLTEKHLGQKTWKDASKVGAGAAAGRLVATLLKVGIAVVIALILTVAAFV
jgi:uncharacterized protein